MTYIPSDDDFDRASRLRKERYRNLDKVENDVKEFSSGICSLYEFGILPQRDVNYRAYIFFRTNEDVQEFIGNGIVAQIKQFVFDALARHSLGSQQELSVDFEIDSHENVIENFEGNYYLRLL